MTREQAISIIDTRLLPEAARRYGLDGYTMRCIPGHEGGRNALYICERRGAPSRVLRFAFLPDRTYEQLLAEAEYVQHLRAHGGSVAGVVPSANGALVETLTHAGHAFHASLFERAPGMLLADNHYRYRQGAPLSEYFYNCGKTLGRLHEISKSYVPARRRYAMTDIYTADFIRDTVPASLPALRDSLLALLPELESLDTGRDEYGMIHFDYNDGNYNIDFETGQITVFDFDNACYGWYFFDLAGVWRSGMGWVQFEPDAGKRRRFMDDYWRTVVEGYRSETSVSDAVLARMPQSRMPQSRMPQSRQPLFFKLVLMENILDEIECARREGEEFECDGSLSYLIRCLVEDIPHLGFFSDIYSHEHPFACEPLEV